MEEKNIIQEYLDGNISGEDLQEFEQRMESDPEFRSEVESLQKVEKELGILGAESFINKVSQWESEYQEQESEDSTPVRSMDSPFKTYYAIAASLVLAVAAGYFLFFGSPASPESVYQEYYSPYEDMILERGDNTIQEQLLNGMKAYNEGRYSEATNYFSPYLEANPEDYRVWFYQGISQAETDMLEAALSSFEKAANDSMFRQQAQWYSALTWLKSGDSEKGIELSLIHI